MFQNVDSGCQIIKTTNCKVLKTIDTCLIKDVSNPWKAPEHKVLYDYISTGYKAGDEFFLMPEVVATYEFGKYKQVFKGSHQHPNSNKVQSLMIKFFTGEGPMEEQNNLLLELLNHAKWALASLFLHSTIQLFFQD